MRTIIVQEPGRMEAIIEDKPVSLQDNEVLIAIKRIGICGTDIHAFGGNQPFFQYPRILGHELSGVVERVGANVSKAEEGDRVAIIPYMHCGKCIACESGKTNCCTQMKVAGVHVDGGMREYLVISEDYVLKVNAISLDDAAMIEPLSIGAHGVRRADIQAGETVLVIGAGPIGLGAARFAKLQGAVTILMDISEERLAYGKEWVKADYTIAASDQAGERLKQLNNGRLPSVVLDATGNKQSMIKAFDYVSHGGKLVYVGLVKDSIAFHDPDFHAKELTLMGSRNATKADFEYVIRCMEAGEVNAAAYITRHIPFDDAPDYFQARMFQTNKAVMVLE